MKLLAIFIFLTLLFGCKSSQKSTDAHLLFAQIDSISSDALKAQSYLLLSHEAARLKDHEFEFALLNELADHQYGPAELAIAKNLLQGRGEKYVEGTAFEWATRAVARDYLPAILFLAKWYRLGGHGVKADLKKTMELYTRAIELGELSAATELGYIFIRHWKEEKGYETAQQLFAHAAYQGDIKALCGLGIVYRESKQLKDLEKAADYFQTSYARGYKECAFELGYLFHRITLQKELALHWYAIASKNGSSDALNNLGMMYNNGDGVDVDYTIARSYFERAIELGGSLSFGNLGSLYELGKGVEQDYLTAISYYQQGVEHQDAQSMHNLANLYNTGTGVDKDRVLALSLFEQAAKLGNQFSAFNLANAYLHGDLKTQSDELAFKYYLQSARSGFAPAFCQAAYIALNESWTMAKPYLYEGAKHGQESCIESLVSGMRSNKERDLPIVELLEELVLKENIVACELLGDIYQNGDFGVSVNFEKAKLHYLKAGELGLGDAFAKLGAIYEEGELTKQDFDMAALLYSKAAEAGSGDGKNNLATLYLNGVSVEKDSTKAMQLYKQAANENNVAAMINLGNIYFARGTPSAIQSACEMYKKAIEHGEDSAAIGYSQCISQLQGDDNAAFELLEERRGQACVLCVVKQADMIITNKIPDKTPQDAMNLLQNAAKYGNAEAALEIARIYESGIIQSPNMALAFDWYNTSVLLGQVNALNKIAEFYWFGKGVDKSEYKAIDAIARLARAKKINVSLFVGEHFYHGLYVDVDFIRARHYFELAAKQNDDIALNALGVIYRDGLGVAANVSLSLDYFKRSAKLGLAEAMYNLGALNLFLNQEELGLAWLHRAAEKQYVRSYILLGDYYAKRESNIESVNQGIKWLKRAAHESALEGMYKLAILLKKHNSNVYSSEAKKWLKAAASGGHPEAASELEVFESNAH
ncbi:sel1 repeat family protein [Pseudoalteromonas luteoviolacea]|uniref:tetratricopeptide repeat protein n=1 Tax=Pseudoalteromonas luteoviolacea TaxID=43657 RepID=UPI001F18D0DC|nr:tetratricopeptide repeat protein [Pseudoalteromonas luteoviolacea]MCF6439536.1 sel1 repeat family protein [Pseudoalteromonas luteoviolacea]